ncbi:MAG: LLM class flavin-dependent oxidoreductase [Chloroflexia bacterium]|nr:LLM class flavin-dependent oxidoreductase [Chloroflexia bacterium]
MGERGWEPAGERGFGVAGTLDHGIVRELAAAAEAAGYATFWVNDVPNGEGLAGLAAAAVVTARIGLGVGVIPLDRQSPERIAARVADLDLPTERLLIGVGSGAPEGGLERVRRGVVALRALSPARIAVGALGPKMCRLAGETADTVLLNWLTPAYVPPSAALTLDAAAEAGRPRPWIVGYVRAALAEGLPRLEAEAARYAGFPAYAANFARMGATALETTVQAADRAGIEAGLAPYLPRLDETVVRAIAAEETAASYLRLLAAAAPR